MRIYLSCANIITTLSMQMTESFPHLNYSSGKTITHNTFRQVGFFRFLSQFGGVRKRAIKLMLSVSP